MSSRALSSTDKQVFTEDEVTVFVSYRDIDGCTPLFLDLLQHMMISFQL